MKLAGVGALLAHDRRPLMGSVLGVVELYTKQQVGSLELSLASSTESESLHRPRARRAVSPSAYKVLEGNPL